MGLLTETVSGLKAISPLPRGAGAGWSWGSRSALLYGRGLPGEREYRSAVGDGSNSSIVEATIMWIAWIARNFPEADLVVTKSDETEDIPQVLRNHPLARKLRRPNTSYMGRNGGYSGVLLWMGTMVSWNIDGNAYWLKRRAPSGAIVEYWYIPHFMIEPRAADEHGVISPDTYVHHYDYRSPTGEIVPLDPIDVFHMRYGIDPENPLKGRSPLRTAYRELFIDEKGAQTTAALLANLGVPGLVISPAKDSKTRPTPDELLAIKARYMQTWGGDRIGEPIVMSSPSEVSQFGFNPEQMSLAALRDIPEERVTALLGVPAAVVGFGTGLQTAKVGATMSELRDQAFENCIIPTQRLAAAELDHQVLPEYVSEKDYDSYAVAFDLSRSTAMLDAFKKKAEIHARLVQSAIEKRGEARSAVGLRTDPQDNVFMPQPGVSATLGDAPPKGDTPPLDEAAVQKAVDAGVQSALRAQSVKALSAPRGPDPDLLRILEHGERAAAAHRAVLTDQQNVFVELIKAIAGRPRTIERSVSARDKNGHIEKTIERELVEEKS